MQDEPTERFCNWSFRRESDLPEGERLRMCTRCRGCCYVSREAQIEHWPIHRKVCCSIEEDWGSLLAVGPNGDFFQNFGSSLQYYLLAFEDPRRWIQGLLLLWAFQGIKRHLPTIPPDRISQFLTANGIGESERGLYNLVNNVFEQCIDQCGQAIIDTIWAIPGWTNYFLSDQPFLSSVIKLRKANLLPAVLPTDTRIVHSPGYLLRAEYVQILVHLYENSWTQLTPVRKIIPSPHRVAIFRAVMRAWSCEYCRSSIPLAGGLRTQLILNAVGMPIQRLGFREYCQPNEIVPGLTAKQFFLNILSDDTFVPYFVMDELVNREEHNDNLFWLFSLIDDYGVHFEEDDTHPWSHFSAKDRLELLDLALGWHFPNEDAGLCPDWAPDYFSDNIWNNVVHLIMGTSTRILLEMHELCHSLLPPPSARIIEFLSNAKAELLHRHIPKVELYNEIMEPRARQRGELHGLPEDLQNLIAAFSLPRKYSLHMFTTPWYRRVQIIHRSGRSHGTESVGGTVRCHHTIFC